MPGGFALKRVILALWFKLGLYRAWRFFSRRKITILMLHGIDDRRDSAEWEPLWPRPTEQSFEESIRILGKYYDFVSLKDAVDILEGNAAPVDHALVLTFDDGYRNNFTTAIPILERLGIPATFFITTGYVETSRAYWIDRLDYAFQKAVEKQSEFEFDGKHYDLRGLDRKELADVYKDFRLKIKRSHSTDREMLEKFDQWSEFFESIGDSSIQEILATDKHAAIATWEMIRSAVSNYVTIGSHSVDHFRLARIPREDVDHQFIQSKTVLEQQLGRECRFFCYPDGSLDEYVRSRARAAGYQAAISSDAGRNGIGDDVYHLRRYAFPSEVINTAFLLRTSGLSRDGMGRFFRKFF